jgi:hypothetical protein
MEELANAYYAGGGISKDTARIIISGMNVTFVTIQRKP